MADETPQPPAPPEAKLWQILSRQQLAGLMGVHADTVTDYVREGMPVVTRGGRGKESEYDALKCMAWWREQQGSNAKEAAQARAANASAQLNEMKIQRERGELLPRAQIVLEGQAIVKQWATAVRGLPRRMTQSGVIQRAQEPAVTALCADFLREISEWRPLAPQPTRKSPK